MIFLSGNLIYLRKRCGWKQSDLAAKLGVKANTISNYEKGTTTPDYGVIHKLIRIFELLLANCARSFERLPCVEDVDLLRNILYSGVWLKYHCKNAKKKDKTA